MTQIILVMALSLYSGDICRGHKKENRSCYAQVFSYNAKAINLQK